MHRLSPPSVLWALALELVGFAVSAAIASAQVAGDLPPDYPIPGGHFYTQTGGGRGGFGVRDIAGVPFLAAYQRTGGPDALGFPISRPFWGPRDLLYQAFQFGLLQWRPDLGEVEVANTMELLEPYDAFLFQTFSIPLPRQPGPGPFEEQLDERLSWLTNDAIREAFVTSPVTGREWDLTQAIDYYGLPQSFPQRSGPFVIQRFQRIPLQLWVEAVSGAPLVGAVVRVPSGELARAAGLMPPDAIVPELPVPPLDVAVAAPRPAPGAPRIPVPPVPGEGAAGSYVVQPGDTLSGIAERQLGDAALWPRLLEANRDQLAVPEDLQAGMVIRLPGGVALPALDKAPDVPPAQPVLQEK